MTQELHVVLGATGGMGSAVVAALGKSGVALRAVNRNGSAAVPTGGQRMAADISTLAGARRAIEGASVVYHCAQPAYTRWAAEFPTMTRSIAEACEEAGAKLVFGDNLYMYGPITGPIAEDSPMRPESKKGRLRREMADDLLERHRAGRLRVAIGRASDYFGPHGADSTPGALLFEPLAKGRKPRWMGRLDAAHTLNYVPDLGHALVTLGRREQADGSAWVLPAGEALTGAQWIEAAGAAAGRTLRPAVVSPLMNRVAGVFVPMVRELNEIMYQFTEPFVVDDSRFRTTFPDAVQVTPHDLALLETVRWFAVAHAGATTRG